MFGEAIPSLLTLPVELVYRILDQFEPLEILLSFRDVSAHLNLITDTYHQYQVDVGFSYLKYHSF